MTQFPDLIPLQVVHSSIATQVQILRNLQLQPGGTIEEQNID